MDQSIVFPVQLPLNFEYLVCIPLVQGGQTLVDWQDYEWASRWQWHILKPWKDSRYAMRRETVNGKSKSILLHRSLMERIIGRTLTFAEKIDHINGNGLDNRRSNIRIATNAENGRNRGKQVDNASGYKGVILDKRDNLWIARIKVNQQSIHLGSHVTREDAARTYDRAAIWYHGDFARLNFPRSDYGVPTEPKLPLLNRRNKTGYKGVVPYKSMDTGRWCAQITVRRKLIHLGTFTDIFEAAKAYDRAAIEHFGKDWPINFPANEK